MENDAVEETSLQKSEPVDWLKVCCPESKLDFEWRTSGNLLQLNEISMRGTDGSLRATIPIPTSPSRSSMVFEEESAGIIRTSHVPPRVLCVIVLFVRGELHVHTVALYIDERDEKTFDFQVMQRAQNYIQTQGPVDKRTYIRAGRVRLLALSDGRLVERATSSVEKSRDWDRSVTKMVAEFCSKDDDHEECMPFMLEVRVEYEWFMINESKTSLDRGIRQVLIENILTNMHGEDFWSKKLLKALFTKETVNALLSEDKSWIAEARQSREMDDDQLQAEQAAFLNYIMPDRTRLLAAMMRTRVEIARLYKLWKSGYKKYDNDPVNICAFGDALDHWEAGDLCKNMASFNPETFTRPNDKREPLRHKRVGAGKIVPVSYDDSEGKRVIGSGSFGTVYRVKVQGDYHEFSANKDESYALKCLNRKLETASEVEGEAGVLEMLALRPHDHITPLYASWTREGLTYILLPKADTSLQKYLYQMPAPNLADQNKVTWLFTQLRGLASAVGHIHHIGFDDPHSTTAAAREARKMKIHMGYHHDLKPDNVLVFEDQLKISDFGAAKIHQLVSGKSTMKTPYTNNSPYGDETYGGPDRLVTSPPTVGQPYDIWSLGCIYLEILSWAFGLDLKDFRQQRINGKPSKCHDKKCDGLQSHGSVHASSHQKISKTEESTTEDEDEVVPNDTFTSSYWYQCENKSCHLKPCVERWLKRLKSCCNKNDLFFRLYQEIRKMLKIQPEARVSAGVVKDNIGNLLYQAEVNFIRHDLEDFGCEMHIGEYESDNTTYVDSASVYVPTSPVGAQRSRSNTLEPPSPHRSPTGHIPGDEVIRDAGTGFDLSGSEKALESGSDTYVNTSRVPTRRRNSTRSNSSKRPSLRLIHPNGRAEHIGHLDESPRPQRRRHKSLDSSSPLRGDRNDSMLNVTMRLRQTQSDLSQNVAEYERTICDTPQLNSSPPKLMTQFPEGSKLEIQAIPDYGPHVQALGKRPSEEVPSTELYWTLCGEYIRQTR